MTGIGAKRERWVLVHRTAPSTIPKVTGTKGQATLSREDGDAEVRDSLDHGVQRPPKIDVLVSDWLRRGSHPTVGRTAPRFRESKLKRKTPSKPVGPAGDGRKRCTQK